MFYPSAPIAIAQFLSDDMPATVMMRALLEHHDWWCPGHRKDQDVFPALVESESSDGRRLLLFTDENAFQCSQAAGLLKPDSKHLRLRPAEHIALLQDTEGVWINPGSSTALKFELEQFKTYCALADGLEVERCLAGLNENPDFYNILRSYTGWWIILVDGQSQLLIVPDTENRQFATAFSAWDAVECALQKIVLGRPTGAGKYHDGTDVQSSPHKSPAVIPMNGAELFGQLQKLQVDGIIFNCAGPIEAKTFSLDFATEVLECQG